MGPRVNESIMRGAEPESLTTAELDLATNPSHIPPFRAL